MASVSWTATTNGTWSNGANWSVATGPQTGDDVVINVSADPLSVAYTGGALSLDTLETTGATLDVTGGALHVVNGYTLQGVTTLSGGVLELDAGGGGASLNGSVAVSGGTLAVVGGSVVQGTGGLDQTGGTILVTRGALTDQENFSTLAGTVSGSGALILDGTTTLASGFVLATASTTIGNTTVYLDENLSYGRGFTLAQGGTLNLGTSTLTLSGLAALDGTIANSVLDLTGTGHFNGLSLENGALASLTGTYTETGTVNLGLAGTGTISIAAGGMLRLAGNAPITNSDAGGTIVNAGVLVKTGGNQVQGVTLISAAIINTGLIDSAAGTIAFSGPSNGATSTLGGTLAGAGTIAFDAGSFAITSTAFDLAVAHTVLTQSANLTLTSSGLTYGGAFSQTGGTLVVGTPGQTGGSALTLTGPVSLDGGLLKGTGTVLCSGAVHLGNSMSLDGNLRFEFGDPAAPASSPAGTVSQTGTVYLGNVQDAITTATLTASESWLLEGNANIIGVNGTIDNLGLFEKVSGGGTSTVQNNFDNAGTLVVNTGVLNLSGGGTLAGTVSGGAALDISGSLAFASSLALSVGELILDGGQIALQGNLAYAHDWSLEAGTLALAGHTLTLGAGGVASFGSGAIQGSGAVVVNGAAIIGQGPIVTQALGLVQGAQLVLNGATSQYGTVALTGGSAAPTLTVGAKGVYSLDTGADIGMPGSSVVGTISVLGTLQATNAGTSTLTASVVDAGAIKVANGDLVFIGPVSGAGSITISNGGTVELNSSTLSTTPVDFGAAGGVLSLAHPSSFAAVVGGFAAGDVIELQGFAFANLTPVISGRTVTLTEASGQSATLTFSTAQSASTLMIGEGPHGGIALIHT